MGMFNPNISQTMEAQSTQTTTRKNRNRFTATTGKTEKEYQQWASQVGQQTHTNTLDRSRC